ncbi:hypothetical protein P7K49_015367, partial [Saguinus oedipus]
KAVVCALSLGRDGFGVSSADSRRGPGVLRPLLERLGVGRELFVSDLPDVKVPLPLIPRMEQETGTPQGPHRPKVLTPT